MKHTIGVVWVLLFSFCGFVPVVSAAAGDLDPTFSFDGVSAEPMGRGADDDVYATAIQADGRIVVVGNARYGGRTYCSVSRFNADGTVDTSFGSGGRSLALINQVPTCRAVAIQTDGKIIAAGSAESFGGPAGGAIFRFNADGSPDLTFSGDGKLTVSIRHIQAVAVQQDGKIVAVGYSPPAISGTTEDFEVLRLNPDGSADVSFDADGIAITPVLAGSDIAYAMAIQADGRIVVAGYSYSPTNQDYALVRYNTDGSLDTTFDGDGKLTTPITLADVAYAVAVQPDGRIVAAGYSTGASNDIFSAVRYQPNGALDTTFDGDGKFTTSVLGLTDYAQAVVIQPDGKILIGGSSSNGSGMVMSVVRLDATGAFDPTFDGDGKVTTSLLGFTDFGYGLALQSDGRVVAAGYGRHPTIISGINNDAILVRYNADGSLDTSFDSDGKLISDTGVDQSTAYAVASQPDGKIVAAGYLLINSRHYFAVARYNTDGTPDMTFDGDGKLETAVRNGTNIAYAVAVQPDGKTIVAGTSQSDGPTNADFGVVRYNPNGSLDTSFDSDGMLTTPFLNPDNRDEPKAIAIQSDGKIIVAGESIYSGGGRAAAFARYNADGSLDTTFDGDGKLTLFDLGLNAAYGVSIQPDGKIVAGGYSGPGFYDFAVVRLNSNGSFDNSFDGDGRVRMDIGTRDDFAYAMALQPDGKIVLAGRSVNGTGGEAGAVGRLNSNGSPDTSFDGDGKLTTSLVTQFDSLALQADGKILGGRGGLVRFQPNGAIDNTFGLGGRTTFNSFGGWSVAIDSRGKAVMGGASADGFFGVARINTSAVSSTAVFDFDADGRTDISVFRPASGIWYLNQSSAGFFGMQFGFGTDKIVPADYDGDGKADIAVYRPSEGQWYIVNSSNGTVAYHVFGLAEDLPAPADYDGDGLADICVFRPSTGTWYRRNSSTGTFFGIQFGEAGDLPTVGDFDGDRKADIGLWRPSNGAWYQVRSSTGAIFIVRLGISTDKIVPADYDGDGRTDIAVWRPSSGTWYIRQSSSVTYITLPFGLPDDIPAPGDFDGDSKADISVFRPSDGVWYRLNSSNSSFSAFPFGTSGDRPTPSAFGN